MEHYLQNCYELVTNGNGKQLLGVINYGIFSTNSYNVLTWGTVSLENMLMSELDTINCHSIFLISLPILLDIPFMVVSLLL